MTAAIATSCPSGEDSTFGPSSWVEYPSDVGAMALPTASALCQLTPSKACVRSNTARETYTCDVGFFSWTVDALPPPFVCSPHHTGPTVPNTAATQARTPAKENTCGEACGGTIASVVPWACTLCVYFVHVYEQPGLGHQQHHP